MSAPQCLFGSSVLPSMIKINGAQVQLGEVVRGAFKVSKLSVRDWNYLDEETREVKIVRYIKSLQNIL
jgi:hypothetical protein